MSALERSDASWGVDEGANASSPLPVSALLAHDWLVSYGGSERVLEELRTLLPSSRVVTAIRREGAVPPGLGDAEPGFLQRIPLASTHHQWFLPLMPLAWRTKGPVDGVDVVLSSSHSCAKAIRVRPGIPHICYCHTPMRYAWDYDSEKGRLIGPLRPPARALMVGLRAWDRRTSDGVTRFVANSTAVAARVRRAYGRDADVVHPPVRTDFFTPGGEREGFFLYVGRFVAYKNAELVVRAFGELPTQRLIVVGDGPQARRLQRIASGNTTFVGRVSDDALRALYRAATALVYPANEDFGIAMAEAQACGTPVVALAEGGALDIVVDGRTGVLIDKAEISILRRAVAQLPKFDSLAIRLNAERFSRERFRARMRNIVLESLSRENGTARIGT